MFYLRRAIQGPGFDYNTYVEVVRRVLLTVFAQNSMFLGWAVSHKHLQITMRAYMEMLCRQVPGGSLLGTLCCHRRDTT